MMNLYSLIKFCASAFLIYVILGDAFLPQPYSNNSQEVRHHINEYLISLLPSEMPNMPKKKSTLNNFKLSPGSENSP